MEGRSCVSVVLCTCNGEKFIEEQLQSVVSQSICPTEIVVCDDCSKDQTLEIVNTFVKKYFTIHWIVKCNTKRLGVRKNFEQAILLASEDYIATCDQDDIWEKDKLENLLALLSSDRSVLLVHSDASLINSNGNLLEKSVFEVYGFKKQLSLKEYILYANNVIGCTMLFRASLRKYLYPFPEKHYFHDNWIAIVAKTYGKISFCEYPLIRYRQHDSNLSATECGNYGMDYFIDRAKGVWFIVCQYSKLRYSYGIFFLLLKEFFFCICGVSWFKYRMKAVWLKKAIR